MKYIAILLVILFSSAFPIPGAAMVSGPCSNCHTMHNSQDGLSMNYDGAPAPNRYLTRGSCIGCHGQSTTSKIVNGIPQVNHRDPSGDLAGGNFAYMLGTKGTGASDTKGHNVIDFGKVDDTLTYPPGGYDEMPYSDELTCAGVYGCHGAPNDYQASNSMKSIAGAHHTLDNVISGNEVGTSYRFLYGVTGREVDDWQNTDKNHHNEYHGKITPTAPQCNSCHFNGRLPANSTITDLCTTCHVHMHEMDGGGDGIWIRHPSDIVLPDQGEYANYTEYNIDAPIGRVDIPVDISNVVTPGTDVVTCLSCHFAHGSDNPDLLRWDYTQSIAGGGDNNKGCFICHSTKDD